MRNVFPPNPELDYQAVMDVLKAYAFPRKAISDALARGDLIRVKKGLYVQSGRGIVPYSKEILANMIYGPSYISLEYALAYYGLIPEQVEEVTSVTTGKSKWFDTPVGMFSFMHLSVDYYGFGFNRKSLEEDRGFLLADPEKAVADRVLKERGRFTLRSMRQFLFESLRIDQAAFGKLDKGLFREASKRSGKESLDMLRRVSEENE
jgi:hypothetical protein